MAAKPTIHILGAGALGSLWATKLSQDNNVVLLIKKTDDQPKFHRFDFIDDDKKKPITLPCEPSTPSPSDTASIDILLVFTKSYDTLTAVKQLQSRITPSCRIILFQNGMGSQQEITQLLPHNAIFAASTTEGANRPDSKTVIYAGKGETWVGDISSQQSITETKAIVALLSSSTLSVAYSANIWETLWLKLAVNCAINPFTALLDCKNGELTDQSLFNTRITPLCHELSLAMQINHIDKTADELQSIIESVIKKTANNVSSMLQDVRAGKQTEIEYINGYIEMVAQSTGRKFPTNLNLLEEVRKNTRL